MYRGTHFNSKTAFGKAMKFGLSNPSYIPTRYGDGRVTTIDVENFINAYGKKTSARPRRSPARPRRSPARPRRSPVRPRRSPVRPVPKKMQTSQKRLSKKAIRALTSKFSDICSVSMYASEDKYLPDPIIGNDYYNLILDPTNNEKREIVYNKLITYGLYPELANRLATPCGGKIDFDSYSH